MRSFLFLCLCACAPAAKAPETTAFVNVNLVPLSDERVRENQTVLVRDGKIVAIGGTVPAGARIIDGSGKYLMPGLADMHTHLVREADLALFVARGVTTVRNMWGTPLHLEWKRRIAEGKILGPTIYTPGPIVDGPEPEHDGSLVLQTPEEAEEAVRLHQRMGYDFIKVYSGLSAPVFARLMQAAKAAGLPVAGHVPRAVGLWAAAEAGMQSVEHLSGLADALQADDSPVKDKFDRAARRQKLDHLDPKKLPLLAQKLREKGLWSCPTRSVKVAFGLDAAATHERLSRPEMRYVPACDRAVWEPGPDDAAGLERSRRGLALDDQAIAALHGAGARILVGTDTLNPLVVPGFTLHQELRLLQADGLSAREVLRAATHDAAEYLHKEDEFGSLAVGQRADLLLLDANPLADLANTERIAGVMVRGRWLPAAELEAMLARVAADVDGKAAAFPGNLEKGEFAARYETSWHDVWFGAERVVVKDGEIHAQSFDPHEGQRVDLRITPGASGDGERLVLASDGANGRGQMELKREGEIAHLSGQLLSGAAARRDEPLARGVVLGAANFLAGHFLTARKLASLAVGQSLELRQKQWALGSQIGASEKSLRITRIADGVGRLGGAEVALRRYELPSEKGPPGMLLVDEKGFPFELDLSAYGAIVRIVRVE